MEGFIGFLNGKHMNFKNDIFISYSRKDVGQVEKIYSYLIQCGLEVWYDRENILAGEKWEKSIKTAISDSKFFMLVISKNSALREGYVEREVAIALDVLKERVNQELYIIPVRVDDSLYPNSNLKSVQNVDLFPDLGAGLNRVITIFIKDATYKTNYEIVGFDLGHGETAVAKTKLYSNSQPDIIEILPGKRSIITAIAFSNTKGLLVGDDAFTEGLSSLNIMFKSNKFDRVETREALKYFVTKCIDLIKNGKIDYDNDTYFFVGCPSGWTESNIKSYEQLLNESGMKHVTVIPESRAAFLDTKESGEYAGVGDTMVESVLLIDIGSSTTDFTIVKNLQEYPINDEGHNFLGGGLIDELIFDHQIKKSLIGKEALDELNKEPSEKAKVILKCREVKEKYFSKEIEGVGDFKIVDGIWLENGDIIKIEVSRKDMELILACPIKALNNQTWAQAFRNELIECKKNRDFFLPKIVLLTGGASRMNFTKKICEEEFPSSKIKIGLEPSLTVAKGLAIAGKVDFLIKSFKSETVDFINSNELKNLIHDTFPYLFKEISNSFIEKIFKKIAGEKLSRWHSGEIKTLGDWETATSKEIRSILKDKGSKIFDEEIQKWIFELSAKIEIQTVPICDKYKIPRTTFKLEISDFPFDYSKDFPFYQEIGETLLVIVALIPFIVFTILAEVLDKVFNSKSSEWVDKLYSELDRKVKTWIQDLDIPIIFRKSFYSTTRFLKNIEDNRKIFEEEIHKKLENEFSDTKILFIIGAIKDILFQRADDASFYIKRNG